LGIGRGDTVAVMLPQRPETVIAHVAVYQMGAIALPLSFLFGPDALEYRLNDSKTKVAIVDEASLPNLVPVRERCAELRHVTGGLMDALMPTLHFGYPILGYRGRFDPEKALALMEQYQVTSSFLFPTALKMMMKAVADPRARHDLALRSIMSAGEAVGTAVFDWSREHLGVTINEMFGQTEMNYVVGNSHTLWPAKPGSIGRPYPGHRVAVLDPDDNEVAPGEVGEIAVRRTAPDGTGDPVFFIG